jgi:hypothetical protein
VGLLDRDEFAPWEIASLVEQHLKVDRSQAIEASRATLDRLRRKGLIEICFRTEATLPSTPLPDERADQLLATDSAWEVAEASVTVFAPHAGRSDTNRPK